MRPCFELDESSKGSYEPVNVLADLIPRYDEELDVLVMWLNKPETKSLSIKQQRIKILQLKLEALAAEMEEDFEVAAMFVGLLERVLSSPSGRWNLWRELNPFLSFSFNFVESDIFSTENAMYSFVWSLAMYNTFVYNRHATDNVRQRDLAKRRIQLRTQRLQQNHDYEKRMITAPDPTHGTHRILN